MSIFTGIPFFEGINPEHAAKYEKKCARKRFSEGELLVDFDDSSADVFFIIFGEVRVLNRTAAGKEMIIGDYGAGKFFGEMAAIDGAQRSANVTAITNSEVLSVPAKIFYEIVLSNRDICDRLLKILTLHVREINTRLFERTVLDIRYRLYSELLRMSSPRKGHEGQAIISPPPYQHDLAARIGCRREQVNRELTIMTEDGLVEKNKGGLVLPRPKILQQRVKEAMSTEE